MNKIFTLFVIILVGIRQCEAVYNASECDLTSHYFDTAMLDCASLPTNSFANDDGKSYTCNTGYQLESFQNRIGWKGTCVACPAGQVASSDGLVCQSCETTIDTTSGDCACPAGQVPVEFDEDGSYLTTKKCVTCASDAYPGPSTKTKRVNKCQKCPKNMEYSDTYECVCKSGYTTAGDTCVSNADLSQLDGNQLASAQQLVYYSVESDDGSLGEARIDKSDTVVYLYNKAAVGCVVYVDPESCNTLANLCALTLYDKNRAICKAYEKAMSSGVQVGPDLGFVKDIPWLFYLDNPTDVITKADIKLEVTFNKKSTTKVNKLDFYLAAYDINGKYLGLYALTNQLLLCPNSAAAGDIISSFGTSVELACEIDLTVFNQTETIFYEMFLKDSDGTFKDVPVKVLNFRDTGNTLPNSKDDIASSKFVRRFFLIDRISSIQEDGGFLANSPPLYMRYAKTIKLVTSVQADDSRKINRPYLIIDYRERRLSSFSSNSTAYVTYESVFEMETKSFWKTVKVLFIITQIILVGVIAAKTYIWYKHNPPRYFPENHTMLMIGNIFQNLVQCWGDGMFFFLFIITGYWFVFFKLQDTVYFLIPDLDSKGDYRPFEVVFGIMVAFQIIKILDLIRKQLKIDIFFIDWEKPKLIYRKEENREAYMQSAWRMLFIANEFNELQTIRYVSVELMLLIYGIFMYGFKWDGLSAVTPFTETEPDPAIPKNHVLKYFISCFVLFIIGMVLYGLRKAVSIWIPTSIQEFTDLCSISNVSLFILDTSFHGYYVHGVSPCGQAEGSAEDLKRFLEIESKAAVRGRGLVANDPTNLQTFEIFVPFELRTRYDMLYKYHLNREIAEKQLYNRQQTNLKLKGKAIPSGFDFKAIEKKRNDLQSYLKIYIEGVVQESTKLIREKTPLMRLFNVPPIDMETFKGSPLFFRDPGFGYQKIILLGHEFSLLLFDISIYLMWDLIFENTFVAIFMTYISDKLIAWIRASWGEKNISQKTLIDDRFLV